MSASEDPALFERRLRGLLQQHAEASSGRVRSRLTQARHAALARAVERRALMGRGLWLPAAGVLAAAAVWAMILVPRRVAEAPPTNASALVRAQDMALLTDRDGLALVESDDGQFYEWAAAQAGSATGSAAAADGSDQNGG
jgi:hypothetical protein